VIDPFPRPAANRLSSAFSHARDAGSAAIVAGVFVVPQEFAERFGGGAGLGASPNLPRRRPDDGDGMSGKRRSRWALILRRAKMKRVVFAAVAVCLAAAPTFAASPKIDAAVKTFKAVSADPAKLKTFCDMSKVMDAMGEKQDAAAEAKIQAFMKQLGADFETAWNAAEGLNESSADGKAYNSAVDDLSGKC
jgi:hypothetical protein